MASPLYQSIEILSREKGIDPQIVVGAVEDAIALATRKFYKTVENMRGEMDKETGEIRAYVFKTVVETPELVEDPDNQLTLEDARAIAPEVEVGGELRFYAGMPAWRVLEAHLRTGDLKFDDPELGLRRLAEILGTLRNHLDA